jgi:FdhE protein
MLIPHGAPCAAILRASERTKERSPQVRDLLEFYEMIFCLQEHLYQELPEPSRGLDLDRILVRRDFGFPLMRRSELIHSEEAGLGLLLALCRMSKEASLQPNPSFERLAEKIRTPEEFRALADGYLNESVRFLERIALETGFTPRNLEFLVYNSLKPSILRHALVLSRHLDAGGIKEQGYCPVCGSSAGSSLLDLQGRRFLVCGFCWQTWEAPLVFCPFCGSNQASDLSFMLLDDDRRVRGDVCDGCAKSIKTLDLREYSHDVYLPLELLGAMPLDVSLSREGYEPGESWVLKS